MTAFSTARCIPKTTLVLLMGLVFGGCPGRGVTAQEGPDPLVNFQTEVVQRLTGGADLAPGVRITQRASPENRELVRAYLEGLLTSMGLQPQRQPYREDGVNVFALLPATSPSARYVVLGAHFDTANRSPGASDNATGCASVLAAARHLAGLSRRSANLYVVLFDEEERGLQGSRAFAHRLQSEGKEVVAVHTVDQMGWDADDDGALELEIPYEGAVELYREAAEGVGFTGPIHITTESGSDHSAFRRLDMPAVGLTEEYRNGDTTPHIHRPTDTWDTVDFQYLAEATRLIQRAMEILLR